MVLKQISLEIVCIELWKFYTVLMQRNVREQSDSGRFGVPILQTNAQMVN